MNIAFEISPLITASGSFGDKSGVYRYTYGLIRSLVKTLKEENKKTKILLFTFNMDLLKQPINPEILELLDGDHIKLLDQYPKINPITLEDHGIFDNAFLKICAKVIDAMTNAKKLYIDYVNRKRFHIYTTFLTKEFKKNKINIIFHSQTGFFPMTGFKNCTTVYDLTPIFMSEFHREETNDLHKRKLVFARRFCDGITCISNSTKKDLLRYSPHFRNKKIIVGYPGLDPHFENNINSINDHNKRFFPLLKNTYKKYLLYYGTFEPRKNLAYLTKAFADLKKKGEIPQDFGLVLTGGDGWGGVKNSIVAFIKENFITHRNKSIVVLDYVNDTHLLQLIKNAYAVVYPSLYEGFGLPVLESMAVGTPVICSNNSSLPEVGGKAALYVQATNFFDIKHKIKHLVSHPRLAQELSQKGIMQSKKFTWEKTAHKALRLLDGL